MDASQLARLPAELRNAIYEATFTSQFAVQLKHNGIQHPMTATCRAMRSEALDMYLTLTRFNAHLDDGPVWPLARWLEAMGPRQCLLLREVNIYDLHDLSGTLHGARATEEMLARGTKDDGHHVLRPIGGQLFRRNWFLKDVMLSLHSIGLSLSQFCIVRGQEELAQMSHFAIVSSARPDGIERALAERSGPSEREQRTRLATQGRREVGGVPAGPGNTLLASDDGRRLTALRQDDMPRDEGVYI